MPGGAVTATFRADWTWGDRVRHRQAVHACSCLTVSRACDVIAPTVLTPRRQRARGRPRPSLRSIRMMHMKHVKPCHLVSALTLAGAAPRADAQGFGDRLERAAEEAAKRRVELVNR